MKKLLAVDELEYPTPWSGGTSTAQVIALKTDLITAISMNAEQSTDMYKLQLAQSLTNHFENLESGHPILEFIVQSIADTDMLVSDKILHRLKKDTKHNLEWKPHYLEALPEIIDWDKATFATPFLFGECLTSMTFFLFGLFSAVILY